MKILSGKIKLGKFSNRVELTIDLDDLFKYQGFRKEWGDIDTQLAGILKISGIFLILISLLIVVINKVNPLTYFLGFETFLSVIPWLAIWFFIYGSYLGRDKSEFDFNLDNKNLIRIKERIEKGRVQELEIDDFLDDFVLDSIDKAYYKDSQHFFSELTRIVTSDSDIQLILSTKFGVTTSKLEMLTNIKSELNNFNDNFQELFLKLFEYALRLESKHIDKFILLIVLFKHFWNEPLADLAVSQINVEGFVKWLRNKIKRDMYTKKWTRLSKLKPRGAVNMSFTSRATPTLDKYSKDLTRQMAEEGFVLSIGKEEVLTQAINTLRKKNAAILILGEPGVGKTFLLKHLASKMVVEDIPKELRDMRLVSVDLNLIAGNASTADSLVSILQKITEEVQKSGNIILVMEELGQIFSLVQEGNMTLINTLSSLINAGNLKTIVTSNNDNFNKYIKPSKNFVSNFEVLEIKEPNEEITFQIITDMVPILEAKHNILIDFNAVKEVVELSPKIAYERYLPDKALDFLEEVVLEAGNRELKFVDGNLVDEILGKKIGTEVGSLKKNEKEKLLNLESELAKKMIGQVEAVKAVSSAIRRSRTRVDKDIKPIASFLFYGPTGVGKTQLAKSIAEVYYGKEELMIRLDMSEFQEDENIERLVGYVDSKGNTVDGILVSKIKKQPFSLLLLDEIEKANPKVLDLFLQVLDDGYINDASGRKIDFTNTLIIATSNAGSNEIASFLQKGLNYRQVEEKVQEILRDVFRIEFLNRFDKLIMFRPLNQIEVGLIADLQLRNLDKELGEQGVTLQWNQETTHEIAEQGYDTAYGAREIHRVIQEEVEDKISERILKDEIKSGSVVVLDGLNISKII